MSFHSILFSANNMGKMWRDWADLWEDGRWRVLGKAQNDVLPFDFIHFKNLNVFQNKKWSFLG